MEPMPMPMASAELRRPVTRPMACRGLRGLEGGEEADA